MRAVVVVLILATTVSIARADDPVCSDIVDCGRKCTKNDGLACSMEAIWEATGKKPDLKAALGWFIKACERDDAFGCKQVAQMFDDGRGATKDHDKAMAIYFRACDHGSDAACIRSGRDRLASTTPIKAPANAAATYTAGCDLGYIPACTELAGLSAPDVAFKLLDKGCAAKDHWACRNLGMYYERGVSVTKDLARAKAMYLEACSAGIGLACSDLGIVIANSPPNTGLANAEAVDAFHKGCLLKHLAACALEGQAFQLGTGVPRDDAKAAAIFVRMCDLGNAKACSKLGYLYDDDSPAPHDYAKAMKLMQLGCDHGDDEGCLGVGFMIGFGHGVPTDVAKGRAIVKALCDRGYQAACERVSVFDAPAPAAPKPPPPKPEKPREINYEALTQKWWQFDSEIKVSNLERKDGADMKIHTRYELKWWLPDRGKKNVTGEAKVTVWVDTVSFLSTWRIEGKLDRTNQTLELKAYEKDVPGLPYGLRYCEPAGTFHFAGEEAAPQLQISWPACPALGTLVLVPR